MASLEVRTTGEILTDRLGKAASDGFWDLEDEPEPRIHRIHPYPAKFPAFLATRALRYATKRGIAVRTMGDVFCGCGTVALEAKRNGVNFWGCDINPVATMIARTKSSSLDAKRLEILSEQILAFAPIAPSAHCLSPRAELRLRRWYSEEQFNALSKLLNAIRAVSPSRGKYREAMLCAFSAILKGCSQWRRRSIKPSLDPDKRPDKPEELFRAQCALMVSAWKETASISETEQRILTANVLTATPPSPKLDLIVTSPPYVTSYEYADLHQLSSLWLGFAEDYRDLREGSIGSTQHYLNFRRDFKHLNAIGTQVVFTLFEKDRAAARNVAKYYLDIQDVAHRCFSFLRANGMALFVIGNTRYKDVDIDNASHLAQSLLEAGFSRIAVERRRISNKSHTPYRDSVGRFSGERTPRQVYADEYVLIAHR